MDDNVADVHQHPPGVDDSFAAQSLHLLVIQGALDGLQESLHLTHVGRRGNDEEVGEAGDLTYVEKYNIIGLILHQGVDQTAGQGGCFQG